MYSKKVPNSLIHVTQYSSYAFPLVPGQLDMTQRCYLEELLTATFSLKSPPYFLMVVLMASTAKVKPLRPSSLSRVVVVITYNGAAIKFI